MHGLQPRLPVVAAAIPALRGKPPHSLGLQPVDNRRKIHPAFPRKQVPENTVHCLLEVDGSNVAAAICNALLYTAVDALDPARRGWQG